jgi:hypothetical protein
MKFYIKSSVILLLLIVMASCTEIPPTPSGAKPDIGIPQDRINSEFKLSVPKVFNTLKIGDEIALNIYVVSKNQIAFGRDRGARIFLSKNNSWEEVPNLMDYGDLESDLYIYKPYSEDPFNMGAIGVIPDLPETGKSMRVRIFLVGSIYREGQLTDEKTASYVDVVLNP